MAEKMKPSGIDWIGDIPNEWDITKVKYRTSQIGSGTTPDSGNPLYYEDGCFPWIQSGDLYNADYIRDTEKKITELAVADFNALTWYEKEFVVVAMYGASVGNIAISQISSYTNQACCVLKAKDDDLRYLFYFLSAGKENMLQMAFGGTQPNISQAIIKNLPYLDVSHNEQQAIADFLDKECGQIDSVAADLEKQIALLQQYKKSLITETVTKGLDKSVPMKDTGVEWIGEIPEHWRLKRLKYIAKLKTGTTPPGNEGINYDENGINWFTPSDFLPNMQLDTSEKYIDRETIRYENIQTYPRGSVLLVAIGATVGKIGISKNNAYSNQQITAVIPQHISGNYLLYYLASKSPYIKDNALYTTLPIINNSYLQNITIVVPPTTEQEKIVEFLNRKCSIIDELIEDKNKLLLRLQQHKKSLIYEYVTGKKRVKEVQ